VTHDAELTRVYDFIDDLDPLSVRFDRVIRATYDQLYDGQRTGRYTWQSLFKTEKTHMGTLVEINVQREFRFADGAVLDFSIEGVEVDCKYSQSQGGWMLPPEAIGQICLVATASDLESRFSVGVVRALPALVNTGANRDRKVTLNRAGKASVRWLHYERPLTENLLLHLSDDERYEIVGKLPGKGNGQRRIDALFRLVQQRVVTRTVVATVAQQDDYMKRVRGNGGARTRLRDEGIVILGDYEAHRRVARALGIVEPAAGGFVSVRLALADDVSVPHVELDGAPWRLAKPDDPPVQAPLLPSVRRSEPG
jgi:hypothetical protein